MTERPRPASTELVVLPQRRAVFSVAETPIFTPSHINGENGNGNGHRRERVPTLVMVDSLHEIQQIEKRYGEWAAPDDTPANMMHHLRNEVTELDEAVITGDRQEIAGELPDVFFNIVKLFNHFDIPMDIAISEKMARNMAKYNPAKMKELREEQGLSSDEAATQLKDKWDKSRDKDFCRSCGRFS